MTPPNPSNLWLTGIILSIAGTIALSLQKVPQEAFKHIKDWLRKKLVYTVTIYQYDELFNILEEYLSHNHKNKYRDVEASLITKSDPNTPPSAPGRAKTTIMPGCSVSYLTTDTIKVSEILFKQEENMFIINHLGKKIFIYKNKEKMDHMQDIKSIFFRKYKLTGWNCKEQINDFLEEIVSLHKSNKPKNTIKLYTSTSYGEWNTFGDYQGRDMNKVFLPTDLKESLLNDIDRFVRDRQWYHDRGIPYKRGYCFYGLPGNGKSTTSLALAVRLGRSVRILNLNSLDNDSSLQRAFGDLGSNDVLLIEDIDKAFVYRENIDSKISFSTFLNCLDGALCKSGLITIITTNHFDKLDPALIRDGRMDVKMEIGNPSADQISEYLSVFYEIPIKLLNIKDLPMSSIQEICIKHKNSYQEAIKQIEPTPLSWDFNNQLGFKDSERGLRIPKKDLVIQD